MPLSNAGWEETVEQATANPGEKRDLPGQCPHCHRCIRCGEEFGPGHESYPCVNRAAR